MSIPDFFQSGFTINQQNKIIIASHQLQVQGYIGFACIHSTHLSHLKMLNAGYTRQRVGCSLGIIENNFFRRALHILKSEEKNMFNSFLIFLCTDIILFPLSG